MYRCVYIYIYIHTHAYIHGNNMNHVCIIHFRYCCYFVQAHDLLTIGHRNFPSSTFIGKCCKLWQHEWYVRHNMCASKANMAECSALVTLL